MAKNQFYLFYFIFILTHISCKNSEHNNLQEDNIILIETFVEKLDINYFKRYDNIHKTKTNKIWITAPTLEGLNDSIIERKNIVIIPSKKINNNFSNFLKIEKIERELDEETVFFNMIASKNDTIGYGNINFQHKRLNDNETITKTNYDFNVHYMSESDKILKDNANKIEIIKLLRKLSNQEKLQQYKDITHYTENGTNKLIFSDSNGVSLKAIHNGGNFIFIEEIDDLVLFPSILYIKDISIYNDSSRIDFSIRVFDEIINEGFYKHSFEVKTDSIGTDTIEHNLVNLY